MFRWGVVGTGRIAGRFADAMADVADGTIVAVASREIQRADAYADRYGVPKRSAGRDDLLADPDVDVVYVATPHAMHEADTVAALDAGKHVLCEKAFALDARAARRMVDAARHADRFLMEAMWSRFLPAYRLLDDLLAGDAIGTPRLVEADFGFRAPFDPANRLFAPALGGGALLDLGVYPVQLCARVLGLPDRVAAQAIVGSTGVDETVTVLSHHERDRLGVVKASTRVALSCTARISGTDGSIGLPAPMHRPQHLVLDRGGSTEVLDAAFTGDGIRFEVGEVQRCLRAGRRESPIMPLDESVALMEVLDNVRRQVGVTYPDAIDDPSDVTP